MKKIFIRIYYYFCIYCLRVIQLFSVRKYMTLFHALLKWRGMKFTGEPRFISSRVKFDNFSMIEIGERVVISDNVILLTHDYSLTTALRSISKFLPSDVAFEKSIKIGNNVFIGMNVLVLPGSIIEDNVIIGAGSVVRGRVYSNTIAIGNPLVAIGDIKDKAILWENKMANSQCIFDKDEK